MKIKYQVESPLNLGFSKCALQAREVNPPNVRSLMVNGKALFYSPEDSKCFIQHTSFTHSHPMVKKY